VTIGPGRATGLALRLGALVVVIAATLLTVPAAATPKESYAVPSSIDGTGESDVTEALQGFFEEVPNGSVIEFPPGARYRVEGTVGLVDRRNLTILGHGATIFATTTGDRTRSQLTLNGGSRLVIRNLVVKGANPSGGVEEPAYRAELEAQHGFQILGATGVELDRVTVTDVYGDFVYVGAIRGNWSRNVWVHNSTFARNGRQGVAVTAGRNIVIERNTIAETRRATFDLEPNTSKGGVKNVFILDNEVGPGRLLFLASHGNGPVDDIVISGNNLVGRALTVSVAAPANARRARFWINDNLSDKGNGPTPIAFENVDDVVVRNNAQIVTREGVAGVGLRDVCGAAVDSNNFGIGVPQTVVGGTECDVEVNQEEPRPPVLRGRDRDDRLELTGRSPTTSTSTAPSPSTVVDTGDGGDGGGSSVLVIGIVLAAVGVTGIVVAILRHRANARRRWYRTYDQ
jgi:Right handed beta helix region